MTIQDQERVAAQKLDEAAKLMKAYGGTEECVAELVATADALIERANRG